MSSRAQNLETELDALSTVENEFWSAKLENGTGTLDIVGNESGSILFEN
jgi:hypothetical protein